MSSKVWPSRVCLGLLPLVVLASCVPSPSEDASTDEHATRAPRILLVGLDGADLREVERLSGAGRLPNLSRLMESGVSAPLRTVANLSPVVWTSIATGVRPEKHGIRAFLGAGRLPVTSKMRMRPAFWNILSHYGRRVGVLGWWATFPAETVDGYMVTPYVKFGKVKELWRRPDPRRTWPPELYDRVAPLMMRDDEVGPEALADVFVDANKTRNTRWVLARDRSYVDVAASLMDSDSLEILAVYLQGIDVSSHDFSNYVYGKNMNRARKPRVPDEDFRAARGRVDAMYERVDHLVGELLENVAPDTDVVVVSDHGWEYDGTGHLNLNPGIFIAAGPSFREAGRVEAISVLDVLPTMLTVLGLPLSRDFDGRAASDLLARSVSPKSEVVEAYPFEAVAVPNETDGQSPQDAEMIERLRGLGYIE